MSWADRLRNLAAGGSRRVLRDALVDLHQGSAARAARLAAHAAQAPTGGMESLLNELAAAEAAIRDDIASALQARGIEIPPAPPAEDDAARNHWARVASDLDMCRAARDRLLRARADILERDPSLIGLIDAILANFDAQADGLRTLIARSDPQAIN